MNDSTDKRSTPIPGLDRRHPWLRIPDLIAIGVISVIAAGAAVVSMMESYTNLLDFALNHNLHGWRADLAPGSVDSFIVIGELLLFVALYRGWNQSRKLRYGTWPALMVTYGWLLAAFGFVLSVLGNLGHANNAGVVTRLMSAVFPVSATVALAAGLMILKRVVRDYRARSSETPVQVRIQQHGTLLQLLGRPGEYSRAGIAPVVHPDPVRGSVVTQMSKGNDLAAEPVPEVPPVKAPRSQRSRSVSPEEIRARSVPLEETFSQSAAPELTPEIRSDLKAGMSARDLSEKYPQLGSRYKTQALVNSYKAGELALNGSGHQNGEVSGG